MPRFAANLSFAFTELPFRKRFAAAAQAGFKAVEYMFPFEMPAEEIRDLLEQNGLIQVLFNLYPGNFPAGERGLLVLEDRKKDFEASITQGLHYAKTLGVGQIHLMAGKTQQDLKAIMPLVVERVRYACDVCAEHGVKVLIEAINPYDMPGYFIHSLPRALDVLDKVGHSNLYLMYDVYHVQRTQGELIRSFADNIDRIAHVQIADNPGRHEPGTGEINFSRLFAAMDQLGYKGWIGLEYTPSTSDGALGWIAELGYSL